MWKILTRNELSGIGGNIFAVYENDSTAFAMPEPD